MTSGLEKTANGIGVAQRACRDFSSPSSPPGGSNLALSSALSRCAFETEVQTPALSSVDPSPSSCTKSGQRCHPGISPGPDEAELTASFDSILCAHISNWFKFLVDRISSSPVGSVRHGVFSLALSEFCNSLRFCMDLLLKCRRVNSYGLANRFCLSWPERLPGNGQKALSASISTPWLVIIADKGDLGAYSGSKPMRSVPVAVLLSCFPALTLQRQR